MLPDTGDWTAACRGFRWDIPQHFNIAHACCDFWADYQPERLALTDVSLDGQITTFSYGALQKASNALANSLRARGINSGDRIGILLPQGPEVLIAHFSALKLGAISLPLFTLFGVQALEFRLADSGAKAIVTDAVNLEKILSIRRKLPGLQQVYCTETAKLPVRDFWSEINAGSDRFQLQNTLADSPAMIIYTSGTTGSPKGALHAHRFLLGHLPAIEMHHGYFPNPGDCGWTPADWAWIGGLMDLAMPCLYYGVPLISHRMRKFDPDAALKLIATHKIRNLFMPPTALKLMQQTTVPKSVDIRSVSSGGEGLDQETLKWGQEMLGAEINEIYGQTECNLVISSAGHVGARRAGSMGQAVPGHDVQVLNSHGQPAAAGSVGEIAIGSPDPVMFLRYWKNSAATAEKYLGDWLCTGDLGVRDEDGYFTFLGRDDDVITSAGYRIGPTEIENCLTSHPDVVSAAVVGLADPVRTEIVKGFVVLRPDAVWEGLEGELIAMVREKVSPHMAPKKIEPISEMPMTVTGKIMRRQLRQRDG